MPTEPATELAVIEATPSPQQEPQPNPKASRAAIKRCMAAWKRVYNENLKYADPTRAEKALAALYASPAYCEAMPPLSGYENIRDFIACAAHGILINAIPEKAGEPTPLRRTDCARLPQLRTQSAKIRLTPTPLPI